MTTSSKKPLIEFKWVASFIVMIGVFMGLLDSTIVNIVLPKMMASLDTDTYGVQWVIISYLVASAIGMTAVGWVGATIGHRTTYILGLLIFTVLSAFCGQAVNLEVMVAARFIQGLGEGLMVPVGMTILFEVFPEKQRGLAMGIYGMGASFAPALGPSLGGLITEHFSWRWIFYINLPVGIIGVLLSFFLLKETKPEEEQSWSFDLIGFLLMSTAFSSLLIFISKGQEKGWLQSDYILAFMVIFAVSFTLFIIVELLTPHPLVDLRIFTSWNYTLSMIPFSLFTMSLYGVALIMPLYLQRLKDYTTLISGVILLPGAFSAAFAIVLGGILSDRFNMKYIFLFSMSLLALLTFNLSLIDYYTPKSLLIQKHILWNFTMAFIFPPAVTIGLKALSKAKVNLGSSLQNATRLLTGSIGTAIAVTILERKHDVYFESFSEYLNYGNIVAMTTFKKLMMFLHQQGTPDLLLQKKAMKLTELFVTKQSLAYAFQSAIGWMSIFLIIGIPFIFFIKSRKDEKNQTLPLH